MLAIVVFAHFVLVVATVRFNQLIYGANEEDRLVEIALILSQPVSTNITVTVSSIDISAEGKYTYTHIYVCVSYQCRLIKMYLLYYVHSYIIITYV